MTDEIRLETRRRLIEKLKGLPARAFKEGNSRSFGMLPHSVSGTHINEHPYCYYDSKNNQLFSIASHHWTTYSQDMAGETQSESGIDYYLRVYSGRRITYEPDFESSGRDVERLYHDIEDKLVKAEEEAEKKKRKSARNKLKRFAGG